ncbi:hypothetical protein AB0N14_12830 [Streptomyces sp. NPDC051104]|uniref:hypothetical protein n=1 Tax=Streptomyces sp. NPDC051104 TaxID=3155044 RepID=UPI00344A9C21
MPGIRNEQAFREAATRVVDLVFTDDDAYLDALPEVVESAIGTPLAEVYMALQEGRSLAELERAVRLLVDVAGDVMSEMPPELAETLRELRFAGRGRT